MSYQSNHHAEVLKHDDVVSIGNYSDYITFADMAPKLDDTVDDVIGRMGAEMSYRMASSIDALMVATNGSELPYIYMEASPRQNIRLTNIAVPNDPSKPAVTRAALVMAVLETRRRFLEDA